LTDVDEYGRRKAPAAGDEVATLLGFLDFQRATFAWRCAGLDSAALQVTVAASTMTLGGMMKHIAGVEDNWFSVWLHGNDEAPAWDAADWDADEDWDWHSAVDDTPDEIRALWEESVARSRLLVDEALADGVGFDRMAARSRRSDGWTPSLRWIVVHMIEEYARHNGHADLIRESIDGQTGQ
jgi:hypothetical protein